jgi:hypoxanthine phosphoribosyltransferase
MTELIPVISEEKIYENIKKTANKISLDYSEKNLVLMGILKGSFIFLADLCRQISISHEVDFLGAKSYEGASSTGKLIFTKKPDINLENKDVLLVEDIVDTGQTLSRIVEFIRTLKPASVKICTLIDKYERRKVHIDVDYQCFVLEKGFLVGYGLDYNEKYRNYPAIYSLNFEE